MKMGQIARICARYSAKLLILLHIERQSEKPAARLCSPTVNHNRKGLCLERLERHRRVAGRTHFLFNEMRLQRDDGEQAWL
jgi:hypothetical protein